MADSTTGPRNARRRRTTGAPSDATPADLPGIVTPSTAGEQDLDASMAHGESPEIAPDVASVPGGITVNVPGAADRVAALEGEVAGLRELMRELIDTVKVSASGPPAASAATAARFEGVRSEPRRPDLSAGTLYYARRGNGLWSYAGVLLDRHQVFELANQPGDERLIRIGMIEQVEPGTEIFTCDECGQPFIGELARRGHFQRRHTGPKSLDEDARLADDDDAIGIKTAPLTFPNAVELPVQI